MSSTTPRPSKGERRDQAREQARALREQQRKREKRNRIISISGLGVAVLVLVIVGVLIVRQADSTSGGVAYTGDDADTLALADVTSPSTATDDGGILVGKSGVAGEGSADDDVVVTIYADYMCPYCGQFEQANDEELDSLREEGGVTVDYRVISFLDAQSAGGQYSSRAGNAAAVVADQTPELFTEFNTALFAKQPKEGTKGLTDQEIADVAKDVGVPSAVIEKFTAAGDGDYRSFAPWLAANTNQANKDLNGLSTPTVLINGKKFEGDLYSAGPLTQAVEAAKG